MRILLLFLTIIVNLCICRDFYFGMFKRNDYLVAQDRLYKERAYHTAVSAKYGRIFKCPITYFRIVDRLGVGRGPKVEIIRGGLQKNHIVLRLTSVYNYPISVNIYVGCENKMTTVRTIPPTTAIKKVTKAIVNTSDVTTPSMTTNSTTGASSNNTLTNDETTNVNSTVSIGTVDNNTTHNTTS